MLRASRIKSLGYFKANSKKVLCELNEVGLPLILTHRGEAKAVIEDIRTYEERQQTLALLKSLALGANGHPGTSRTPHPEEGAKRPSRRVGNAKTGSHPSRRRA